MKLSFDTFVLAAATNDLADERPAREHADAVEFRMDLASDPLDQLAGYDGTLPIIATNRIRAEGGESAAGPDRRDAVARAVRTDAVAAVDIELRAIEDGRVNDLLNVADETGIPVIASAHDFEGTPARETMRETLERATSAATVGKLAVRATSTSDVLDLLAVTLDRTAAGQRVATMAMGAKGRHSRAVAPVYGSKIGYAPVDPADATAPGQYDLATLRRLVTELSGAD